jgi:putative selenium metabolism protein SsnA
MGRLWIKNGLVWTGGDRPQVFQGGVLCAEGRIEATGTDAQLALLAGGAEVIDGQGRLVAPGWINAHMHLYSTLARGVALKDPPPQDFLQILQRLWWRLDKALTLADLGPGADMVLIDALQSGVTTIIDHHASPNAVDGSLDVLAGSAQKAGVRLCTCYEVSDRDGPERMQAGIFENLRFAKAVQGQSMLAAMFGLHASMTLSDPTLERCAVAGHSLGLPFHVHVAESAADVSDAQRRGHRGVLSRLVSASVLNRGSIAAHCVHTLAEEWPLLRENGIVCIHNPQSNMNNAVGAAPIYEMMQHGVEVGIGSDGMEADVREELRSAFLMDHHRRADPQGMWAEAPALVSTNRRLASSLFGVQLGELAPGTGADIVVYDYHPPTPLTSENFWGHFFFGGYRALAHTVVVAGQIRLANRQPLGLDAMETSARARQQAVRLWERF